MKQGQHDRASQMRSEAAQRTDEGVSDPDETGSSQSEVLRDGEVLCGSVDVLDSRCDQTPAPKHQIVSRVVQHQYSAHHLNIGAQKRMVLQTSAICELTRRFKLDRIAPYFGPAGLFMKAWKPFCWAAAPAAAMI